MAAYQQIRIIDGDNKNLMTVQPQDIGRVKSRPMFKLVLDIKGQVAVIWIWIDGFVAEDGSGENWLIMGRIDRDSVELYPELANYESFSLQNPGYYNTTSRRGYLRTL